MTKDTVERLIAKFNNDENRIKQLDKEKEDKKRSLGIIFHEAVMSGNIKEMDRVSQDPNLDVNAQNAQGKNALGIAIDLNRPDLVFSLLNYPAIKNVVDDALDYALKHVLDNTAKKIKNLKYDAIQKNNFEIMQYLVDKGANCSRDSFANAVLANNIEVVRLLTKGTKKYRHIEDIIKNTNIFIDAWEKGVSNDMLRELGRLGGNGNYYPKGEKRLYKSTFYKSNTENKDLYNTSFLYDSLSKGDCERAELLLTDCGADPFLPTKKGQTPEDLIKQLNNKNLNEAYESAKTRRAEAWELMKKIYISKEDPANYNDTQLNQLMTVLNNGTLTYLIKLEDNLGFTTKGVGKSNRIIGEAQGAILKHFGKKKRVLDMKQQALAIAGVTLKPSTSGASNLTLPHRSNPSERKVPGQAR